MSFRASLNALLPFATAPCNALAISPCHLLALSLASTVLVYDCLSLRRVRVLEVHTATITAVAWQRSAPVLVTATLSGELAFTDFAADTTRKTELRTAGIEALLCVSVGVVFTETSGDIGLLVEGAEEVRMRTGMRWHTAALSGDTLRDVLLTNKTEGTVAVLSVDFEVFSRSALQTHSASGLVDSAWVPQRSASVFLLFPSEVYLIHTEAWTPLSVLPCQSSCDFRFLLFDESDFGSLICLHEDLSCSVWRRQAQEFEFQQCVPVLAPRAKDTHPLLAAMAPTAATAMRAPFAVVTSDLRLHLLTCDSQKTRLKYCEKLALEYSVAALSDTYVFVAHQQMLQAVNLQNRQLEMELALYGQVQAVAAAGSEAFVAVAADSIEVCDAQTLKTTSVVQKFDGEVVALACSPCGLFLAAADCTSLRLFQRKAKESPFTLVGTEPASYGKLLWTNSFGLVCYGSETTLLIDSSMNKTQAELRMATVAEVDSELVFSDAREEVWHYDGLTAEKCACVGSVVGAVADCAVLLHDKKLVGFSLRSGVVCSVSASASTVAHPGICKSHNGLLLLQACSAVLATEDSPALALLRRNIASPSLTATPHFSVAPFEFESAPRPALPPAILQDLSELNRLPMLDRREKQAKLRGDLDEMRFWSLLKQHESALWRHKAQDISVVSTLSLETVRRSGVRGTPKSTSRGKKDPPTPVKKSGKVSQSFHTKNAYSTPVRSKGATKPALGKKQSTTRSTSRLQMSAQSERKTRPDSDVIQLAMNTSALLQTCFDSNRRRQPLASDGESQVTDQMLDCSDVEGSCKSDSPSPCRKRSESKVVTETLVTFDRSGELSTVTSGVLCRELLGTGPEKPEFLTNVLKACVFASTVSISFHHTVLYEAAQRLGDCGLVFEAAELLCAAGRHYEASCLLQTHRKWLQSLSLARRCLSEADVKSLVAKWVAWLCEQKQYLEAARVSMEQQQWLLVTEVLQKWGKTDLAATYQKLSLDDAPSVDEF